MLHPLLMTKLYLPPARSGLVGRPRLTSWLTRALRRPLTLISAPAGFGKSTLLSQWCGPAEGNAPETPDFSVAWLSLDEGDNDPEWFWAYVLAALRNVPGIAAGLPDEIDAGAPPQILLAPLINGIDKVTAQTPSRGCTLLVMDDYHTIESSAIQSAVGYLAEHLPAGLRLAILTRVDPPWPLARFRTNGILSELRADDLRFAPDEAVDFLTETMGLNLTGSDVAALEERTEGWIAALQMAAISLDGHPDPHSFIGAFSGENRYIADYLMEEVLTAQSEPLRRFLLQSSILDEFCAPLCDAVAGEGARGSHGGVGGSLGGQALLEQAERKGLFLVPLDGERRWYRFHHLFGDLLRSYLRRVEPDSEPALHARASAWYAENGRTMDAARHSLAARDYDRVLALVEQHAHGWWAMAGPAFLDLMLKLPPEVITRSPGPCTGLAWMNCVLGKLDLAAALLDAVDKHAERAPLAPDIASFGALLRTYIAELSGKPIKVTEPVLLAPTYIPEKETAAKVVEKVAG